MATTLSAGDTAAFQRLLDHDNFDMRDRMRQLLSNDPLFFPRYYIPLHEERALALQRLQKICDAQLFSVKDFTSRPSRIFAAHEMCAMLGDGSTCTKMTV